MARLLEFLEIGAVQLSAQLSSGPQMDDGSFLDLDCKKFQAVLRSTACSAYVRFQGYFKFVCRFFFLFCFFETEPFKI